MKGRNPVSTDNYYKDLWNNPNTEAGQFFNKTDFNHPDYKRQEEVFRYFLKIIKDRSDDINEPIETVLEVGAGTARMTLITLEELPDIIRYDAVDTKMVFNSPPDNKLQWHNMDIMSREFDIVFGNMNIYDMVLASEVFMHIKPDDISPVISKLSSLLAPNGLIINIDWYHQPEPSTWCYIHDYDKMYRENGLYPVFEATINKQKLFCYGK